MSSAVARHPGEWSLAFGLLTSAASTIKLDTRGVYKKANRSNETADQATIPRVPSVVLLQAMCTVILVASRRRCG